MSNHVLVLYPHPDDETMASGGEIALHAAQGVPVTYACFTLGQMGRNMGIPIRATRESLPEIRKAELMEAAKHLGISDLRLLGFRDKTLEFEDPEMLADIVYDMLVELRPHLVITYYPGYAVHPDHEAIAVATVRAVRRLPEGERPNLHCHAFANNTRQDLGEPDVVLDTTSVSEPMFLAFKAHASQTSAWIHQLEQEQKKDGSQSEWSGRFARETAYTYHV